MHRRKGQRIFVNLLTWLVIIGQISSSAAYADIKSLNKVLDTLAPQSPFKRASASGNSGELKESILSGMKLLTVARAIGSHLFSGGSIETAPRIVRDRFRNDPSFLEGLDLEHMGMVGDVVHLPFARNGVTYDAQIFPNEKSHAPFGIAVFSEDGVRASASGYIVDLSDKEAKDAKKTGGKGASLAELADTPGIRTRDAFCVTTAALRKVLSSLKIKEIDSIEEFSEEWIDLEVRKQSIGNENKRKAMEERQRELSVRINELSAAIRQAISECEVPEEIRTQVIDRYREWRKEERSFVPVAVRSSGEAEDTTLEAFAGSYNTYINVTNADMILDRIRLCWASLFNEKPIWERNRVKARLTAESKQDLLTFSHKDTSLAVVVQKLVIDPPASFIAFSIDPHTGRPGIRIDATYGYGEGLVGSNVAHDSWFLSPDGEEILERELGKKTERKARDKNGGLATVRNREDMVSVYCLSDEEVRRIAKSVIAIKEKYRKNVDCEGALEPSREAVFLQARPETKYSTQADIEMTVIDEERAPRERLKVFEGGISGSPGVVSSVLQYLGSVDDYTKVKPGTILVTPRTTHNWTPYFHMLRGVVTDIGGVTDHAAITGRNLGIPALVGTEKGTEVLKRFDGQVVTLDANGMVVYLGELPVKKVVERRKIWLEKPDTLAPEKSRADEMEEMWAGATAAGQTWIDNEGRRWIGRPNYPLKKLQLDIYDKAFDLLERRLGITLRRELKDGILAIPFEDNCNIDWALRNLALDELERINEEKKKTVREFMQLAEGFEPTRRNIERFIDLYTLINFYMDLGFQFDEACQSLAVRALRFIAPPFRTRFLKLAYTGGKTEANKMAEELAQLLSYARENHLPLFTSLKDQPLQIASRLMSMDEAFFRELVSWMERYKKFGSYLMAERPIEELIREFGARVRGEEQLKEDERVQQEDRQISDTDYSIQRALAAYPTLHRALRLAVEGKHITEDLHHFKARAQWPISDGLYKLGRILADRGRLGNPEDIFDLSAEQLLALFDEPILEINAPASVSVLTMQAGWRDNALASSTEISLGAQLRIDASIRVNDFEHLAREYAEAARNGDQTEMDERMRKAAVISQNIKAQLWSNLTGKWELSEPMEFVGFSGDDFRFSIVLTPKSPGSFSYNIRCKTDFQDDYFETESYGKLIVRHKEEERIVVNLNGIDALLDDRKIAEEMVSAVKEAAKRVREWKESKRLGYRMLPEQPESLLAEIEDHVSERIRAGVRDVILIGQGGQSGPNRMLQEALRPELYNSFPEMRGHYPRIHILDNLDDKALEDYFKENGLDPRYTDICISSKSGDTLETLINGYYLVNWLTAALGDDAEEHVIAVTNDNEPPTGRLNEFLAGRRIKRWYIPTRDEDVGGRFSTLSPGGLITAAYAGIDIRQLLRGATSMRNELLDLTDEESISIDKIKKNKAILAALLAFRHLQDGREILAVTTFSSRLRAAADFSRQLFGESLAKDDKGPFPIIVSGEGTLQEVAKSQPDKFFLILNYLAGRGLLPDLKPHGYMSIDIPELDEFTLGELLYLMQEIVVWYGALLGIDPLVQPKVQLAKDITQEELGRADLAAVAPANTVVLHDAGIFDTANLSAENLRDIMASLGQEDALPQADSTAPEIDNALNVIAQFSKDMQARYIERVVILGNRDHILKTRAVYEAFYQTLSARYAALGRMLPEIEFIDETREERLREFISCADPKRTLAQVMVSSADANAMISNLRILMGFMGTVPQNVLFTSDVPTFPPAVRSYIGKSASFVAPNEDVNNELARNGLSINEIAAFSLFGMEASEIKAFMEGYRESSDDIARKIAAYSYLLYQTSDTPSCSVNMIFSYSNRFEYFNSWAKDLFRRTLANVSRGPSVDSAIGSTDQHSILEGMLNWKNGVFTIFVTAGESESGLMPMQGDTLASALLFPSLSGRGMSYVLKKMHAGVSRAFAKSGRPNVTVELPRLDYRNFGALLGIFEKAAGYEEKFFKRDIDEHVPPRVLPVVPAVRRYAEEMKINVGEIDEEIYYHYSIIRSLYGYNDSLAMPAIWNEMRKTKRSFRDVVCGIMGRGLARSPGEAHKGLITDALYFGGGGFGACSIATEIMQRYMALPEGERKRMAPYAVAAITTAYDDWGNSRQIIDMFLRAWRVYIPAVGDPSAVISWLTTPAEAWFNASRPQDFKPESVNPKMDLVYSDKNRITLSGKGDTLERHFMERIREVHDDPTFVKPDDWLFFIANLIDIARLFDREFVAQGYMNFDKISLQNLVAMGGMIDAGLVGKRKDVAPDPNLERAMEIMGLRSAYIVPVTYAQEMKGAELVGYRQDGSELFGQNNISSMESGKRTGRIDYVTLRRVIRDRFGKIIGASSLRPEELPEISLQARRLIQDARSVIITGAGSPFTSITANLLTRGFVEELSRRRDIPRIFVLPPMDTMETYGHTVESVIRAMEKSMQVTLGDSNINFEDIFDYVVLPRIPPSLITKYEDTIRAERSVYLNEDGKTALATARTTEEIIDVVREERYQSEETIRGLEAGSPKMEKILPTNPFPITKKDRRFLHYKKIEVVEISGEESFIIWEGRIAYRPHVLVDAIEEIKESFARQKAEGRASASGDEEIRIKEIEHLSFGGGGWHNCSLMRAMRELPQRGDGREMVSTAHLVPTVDSGGHGRILGDEARKNFGLYIPSFGDFAGVMSWLTGEWDSDNTFSDITSSGAKMALLYGTRFKGEELTPQVIEKIREVEAKIRDGQYRRPDDWDSFRSNMIKLSKLLDETLISGRKITLRNASFQNLIAFAVLINSGVRKTMGADGRVAWASLDRNRNFVTRLFDALGVKNAALQFQTYDHASLVAVLEGCVLRIGEDAVILRRRGDRVISAVVRKDSVGNFVTTPLGIEEEAGFNLGAHRVEVAPGESPQSIAVKIGGVGFILDEGREDETIVRFADKAEIANLDASWSEFSADGIGFSVMSRRIDSQFFVAMEEHISRIEKVYLKRIQPKRMQDGSIVYDDATGWIAYEVSDENANVAPTPWAVDFIRAAKKTIRFDPGGALTTQVAALLNKGIVEELREKNIPRIYIPPLTKDVIVSGLSLKEIIQIMEKSMRDAIGEESVNFEDIFDYIIMPDVPQEVKERYVESVKKQAEKRLNERGLEKLVQASTIEDLRNIFNDDANLSEETLRELYSDPAKVKAKRKQMLPATLLPVTEEDIRYLEQEKGLGIVRVSGPEYFGIWEDKIVYEPRSLRDLIISIGERGVAKPPSKSRGSASGMKIEFSDSAKYARLRPKSSRITDEECEAAIKDALIKGRLLLDTVEARTGRAHIELKDMGDIKITCIGEHLSERIYLVESAYRSRHIEFVLSVDQHYTGQGGVSLTTAPREFDNMKELNAIDRATGHKYTPTVYAMAYGEVASSAARRTVRIPMFTMEYLGGYEGLYPVRVLDSIRFRSIDPRAGWQISGKERDRVLRQMVKIVTWYYIRLGYKAIPVRVMAGDFVFHHKGAIERGPDLDDDYVAFFMDEFYKSLEGVSDTVKLCAARDLVKKSIPQFIHELLTYPVATTHRLVSGASSTRDERHNLFTPQIIELGILEALSDLHADRAAARSEFNNWMRQYRRSGYYSRRSASGMPEQERIRQAMLEDDWKYLLQELRASLIPDQDFSKLRNLLTVYNEASLSQPNYPIESRYPILRAVALLSREEQDRLVGLLKESPNNDLRRSNAIADSILLMLEKEIPKDWLSTWAPNLIGRRIWQIASEIWYAGGGLGRVMQYHGIAMAEFLRSNGIELSHVEPDYRFRYDWDGSLVPVEYSSLPIPLIGLELVERFPVKVGSKTTEAFCFRAKNPFGLTNYLIRDGEWHATKMMYNYGTSDNPVSWEDFSEFFSRASLELIHRVEAKERSKNPQWKESLIHTNDAQVALFPLFEEETHAGLTDSINAFTTHTYPHRRIYDTGTGRSILTGWGIDPIHWRYFEHMTAGWNPVFDVTSAGSRTADWAGGVSKKHVQDVTAYDQWAGVELVAVTNGDLRAVTAKKFRKIMLGLFPDADIEHPTPSQVRGTKEEAKRRLSRNLKERFDLPENPIDENKPIVSYSGRLVPEKAGRERAFTDANIEELVKMGVQVVIYGNVQPGDDRSIELKRGLDGLMRRLEEKDYPGRLIFVPDFDIEDQRLLLAATDVQVQDSDPNTEAAGFTEADIAVFGGLELAPPWPEGILQAQGVKINLEVPGEGNTLIPEDSKPESYLKILQDVLSKSPEELAEYQATSVRLSRVLEARLTAAEYLRQFNQAVARKEAATNGASRQSASGLEKIANEMELLHKIDLNLMPPVDKAKTLWHVIPTSLIAQNPYYNQRTKFVEFVHGLNRRYRNVREKIRVVTDAQLVEIVEHLAADPNNIVDVALGDENYIDRLADGVKMLVFKPEGGKLGDFRQLEGILASLRALHIRDRVQMAERLSRLYEILTGKAPLKIPDISDPKEFARKLIFVLPPIVVENYEDLRRLNESLLKLIESA